MGADGAGVTPERVLILKPSAIGDVVHALPALALMRRAWPGARIDWLVSPACAGLLEGHPLLDEVVLFERRVLGGGGLAAVRGTAGLVGRLRGARYDVVVDLQGLLRTAVLGWMTGAGVRYGEAGARETASAYYTHAVDTGGRDRHAVERYLDVCEAMGVGRGPVEFVFNTTARERAVVRGLVGERAYAVVLPGTNWVTKRWPAAGFAEVARRLRGEGLAVMAAGGPGDRELCAAVGADVDLAGRTSLRETVALLEGAAVVVANDSGPMHIAAALGRPLVTVFGPTNAARTGPWGRGESVVRLEIACSPCYSRRCVHRSCMEGLAPAVVADLAIAAVGGGGVTKASSLAGSPMR